MHSQGAATFLLFASLRSPQQAVAIMQSDVLLICLAGTADGRLPRRHEAFHERYPHQSPSIVAQRAHAADGARAGDRSLA